MRRLLIVVGTVALLAPAAAHGGEAATPQRWTRAGTGLVNAIATADVDGDGANEVLVGGRGVAAIDETSLIDGRAVWTNKWPDGAALSGAGDNSFAKAFAVSDVNDDRIPDALVGGDEGLYALDGATGAPVWRNTTETTNGGHNVTAISLADFDDDGTDDVVLAHFLHERVFSIDGGDGSVQWTYPRFGRTAAFATADLNGDGAPDVVQVGSSFGAGPQVHAISGLGAAATGVASPLWVQQFPGGDPTAVVVGQVVAGGGDEVVVGGFSGDIVVFEAATGHQLAAWKRPGRVADLAVVDADGDGDVEIVVANGYEDDGGAATSIDVYDGDGRLRWSRETPAPPAALATRDLDGDDRPEVVAVGGWITFGGRSEHDGFAMALDGDGGVRWERGLASSLGVVQAAQAFGEEVLLVGHEREGGVAALGLDGALRWEFRTGGQVAAVAAADLDADGRDEVLEGDHDATVAVTDGSGRLRWRARAPGIGGPDVVTVTGADLDNDGVGEVLAGTFEYGRGGPGGRLHAFSQTHGLLWSYDTTGAFGQVRTSDLDGDGNVDVVAGAGGAGLGGDGSRLARLGGDGAPVWERDLPPSLGLFVELAEIGGDAGIVAATSPLFGPSFVLRFDAGGREHWRFQPAGILKWVDVAGDLVAVGDSQGFVYALDGASGAQLWRRKVPGRASAGGWSTDTAGDAVPEVAVATSERAVHLLDGASGDEVWRASLNGPDPASTLTVGRGHGRTVVAVGSTSNTNGRRGGVYLFDAASGRRLLRARTEHHVADLARGDLDGDGADEVLAAAGWQLHVLAPGYTGEAPPEPARVEMTGRVVGSNIAAQFGAGVTEAELRATCRVPATQGADGYVFDLPAPVRRGASGEVAGTAGVGFADLSVALYSDDCRPLGSTSSQQYIGVPPGTRYAVVTVLNGAATDVRLALVADE